MICRVWRGWTTLSNAQGYDDYLQKELFPHLSQELRQHGFRGYQLLRLDCREIEGHEKGRENKDRPERPGETEFMTMLFFDSIDNVRAFAGENYEVPVISEKAHKLLSRFADRADHYNVSGSQLPPDRH